MRGFAIQSANQGLSGSYLQGLVQREFAKAGVVVNGTQPWDIQVHDGVFYRRMVLGADLQFGEMYVEGIWDCERIDLLFAKLLKANIAQKRERGVPHKLRSLLARVMNHQSVERATEVAVHHYDAGNDLFAAMLDSTMTYTCADYGKGATTLCDAQLDKLDDVCTSLNLKTGDRLLDIGCGWGGLAKHAATHYGASVVGITISREQLALARHATKHLGNVDIRFMDYRDLPASGLVFDAVSSIEMIEAVGPKNYEQFFSAVQKCLVPQGALFLQCFGANQSVNVCNAWFDKYIFPNGVSPSLQQLGAGVESSFGAHRWSRDIGPMYEKTLMAWSRNLAVNWPRVAAKYEHKFYRTFQFYLQSLAGVFSARHLRLFQQLYVNDR